MKEIIKSCLRSDSSRRMNCEEIVDKLPIDFQDKNFSNLLITDST